MYFAIISKALGVQIEKFLYGVFLAVHLSSVSTCNVAEDNEASIPGTNSQSLLAENSIILVQAIYTKLEGKKKSYLIDMLDQQKLFLLFMHQHDKLVLFLNFLLRDQPVFYNIHMYVHSFVLDFCGT